MKFTLIGDSNVRRHMSELNCRDRPLMSGAQVLLCGHPGVFSEAINSIRAESDVCIVACVTNFLTSALTDASSSISLRIEPIFRDFLAVLRASIDQHPGRHYLLCPPMYRRSPVWYREGLPEVLTKFSAIFCEVSGLHLMTSFSNPVFESDGIHFTPYSGLEYVLHLFDSAQKLLTDLANPEGLGPRNSEAARVLEDRVLCLEQDHRRLNESHELKAALDAELADFHQNISMESHITISGPGLTRAPQGMSPKDWQTKAKEDVGIILNKLMGRPITIVFVSNGTSRRKDADPRYHVHLTSVQESKAIRDHFKTFFASGKYKGPEDFKGLAIRNHVTQETRIRIAIMQLIAKHYRDSNPDGKATVIGFESRPFLKITPPEGTSGFRVKSYFYVQAVKSFPTTFSDEDLKPILGMTGADHRGKLRSLFVVLNNDMMRKSRHAQDQGNPPETPRGTESTQSSSAGHDGNRSRSKSKSKSKGSRSNKRGADSPADGPSVAKK